MFLSQYELDEEIEAAKRKVMVGVSFSGKTMIMFTMNSISASSKFVKRTGVRIIELTNRSENGFDAIAALPVSCEVDPQAGVVNMYVKVQLTDMSSILNDEKLAIGICKTEDFEEIKNFINS